MKKMTMKLLEEKEHYSTKKDEKIRKILTGRNLSN
jgi:hypothetical protein